jgi:hypothetical protein
MLDTKQKRGSVMGMGLPPRVWLAEPSGALPVGSRLSLLKLGAGVTPTAATVVAGRVYGVLARRRIFWVTQR